MNLAGARGVLVNITASSGLKMKEYHEVMNTIKEFTAEDAMVIVGTVIDDAMGDELRVTMIATGLGGAQRSRNEQRQPKLEVVGARWSSAPAPTASACAIGDHRLRQARRSRRWCARRAATARPAAPSFDASDIPAFLRKQAD